MKKRPFAAKGQNSTLPFVGCEIRKLNGRYLSTLRILPASIGFTFALSGIECSLYVEHTLLKSRELSYVQVSSKMLRLAPSDPDDRLLAETTIDTNTNT